MNKKTIRKLLCMILCLSLLCISTVFAQSTPPSAFQDNQLSSVKTYQPITDLDQLVDLAVQQYEERLNSPTVLSADAVPDSDEDLVAVQLIKEETRSNGTVVKTYQNTGLLVLDEQGNKLSAQETVQLKKTDSGSWHGNQVYGTLVLLMEVYFDGYGTPFARGITVTASSGHSGSNYYTTKIYLHYNAQDDLGLNDINRSQWYHNPSGNCVLGCLDNSFHDFTNSVKGGMSADGTFYINSGSVYQLSVNPNDLF